MKLELEKITRDNYDIAKSIMRDDIPAEFVGGVDELIDNMEYGLKHKMKGSGFYVRADDKYVGYLMIGEAIPWPTDPPELEGRDFYRLMYFVIDKSYRHQGIGGGALEMAIEDTFREYGERPLSLGCHKENRLAEMFYEKHGFRKTEYMEGGDYYMLRGI